jgi:hypothetical protein
VRLCSWERPNKRLQRPSGTSTMPTYAKKYRDFETGENHFGFAFTCAWRAAVSCPSGRWLVSWNHD